MPAACGSGLRGGSGRCGPAAQGGGMSESSARPVEERAVPSAAVPVETVTGPEAAWPRPEIRVSAHAAVWALAWPSVTTMLLQTVNSLMDVFFVGHLPYSAQALAATGVGGQMIFLLVSLSM